MQLTVCSVPRPSPERGKQQGLSMNQTGGDRGTERPHPAPGPGTCSTLGLISKTSNLPREGHPPAQEHTLRSGGRNLNFGIRTQVLPREEGHRPRAPSRLPAACPDQHRTREEGMCGVGVLPRTHCFIVNVTTQHLLWASCGAKYPTGLTLFNAQTGPSELRTYF